MSLNFCETIHFMLPVNDLFLSTPSKNVFNCYIKNKERLNTLLQLLKQTRIAKLPKENQDLPEDIVIHLIDKSSINDNFQGLHSHIKQMCWVLIEDGSDNVYPDIYKTAIHHAKWEALLWECEKELLLIIDKSTSVDKLVGNQLKYE